MLAFSHSSQVSIKIVPCCTDVCKKRSIWLCRPWYNNSETRQEYYLPLGRCQKLINYWCVVNLDQHFPHLFCPVLCRNHVFLNTFSSLWGLIMEFFQTSPYNSACTYPWTLILGLLQFVHKVYVSFFTLFTGFNKNCPLLHWCM